MKVSKRVIIFSLHVPLNEQTKNLIDYSKLKNMKKEAIIINTARGGIINEEDLNKALNEGIILELVWMSLKTNQLIKTIYFLKTIEFY